MEEEQKEQLEKDYDKDLRDMVETYRAFKKMGVIGTAIFGIVVGIAGLIWTIVQIMKGLK